MFSISWVGFRLVFWFRLWLVCLFQRCSRFPLRKRCVSQGGAPPEQSEAAPAEAVATPTKQPLWNDGAWKETGDDSSDDGGSGPSVSAYRSFRAEQSAGSRGLWQNGRWQRTASDDE